MSKEKIAIVTLYNKGYPNYGNIFQNYACERIYAKMGYDVYTLVKERPFSDIDIIKYRVERLINAASGYRISHKQGLWNRYILFREFEKKYLHINYISLQNRKNTDYDYYSIGSDQVWNPNWLKTEDDCKWFFCEDIHADKCICLSASFGVDAIPKEKIDLYSRTLDRLEWLSVREDNGRTMVKELTGKDVQVLIDPTLALSKAGWNKIQKKPRFIQKGTKYIFCYFLGGISEERKTVFEQYGKQNNILIFDVMDDKSKLSSMGPSEFLWTLAHAEMVFTDSFHGSVFAIIYEKPLLVFKREGKNNYMFSRLETFLRKFRLEDRIITDLNKLPQEIDTDYSEIHTILKEEQRKLWLFLYSFFQSRK